MVTIRQYEGVFHLKSVLLTYFSRACAGKCVLKYIYINILLVWTNTFSHYKGNLVQEFFLIFEY